MAGTQPALKSAPSLSPPRLPRSAEGSAGTAGAGTSAAGQTWGQRARVRAWGRGARTGTEETEIAAGDRPVPPQLARLPPAAPLRQGFQPRREFVCTESPASGYCGVCAGPCGRAERSVRCSCHGRAAGPCAGRATRGLHPLALSCPRPSLRVWRVTLGTRATGWAAESAGSRRGSERSRGSGRGSARPASQSPLSEPGSSILHPPRSSLGEAGEPSDRQWEPVESGQNFGPAQDTCPGKFG